MSRLQLLTAHAPQIPRDGGLQVHQVHPLCLRHELRPPLLAGLLQPQPHWGVPLHSRALYHFRGDDLLVRTRHFHWHDPAGHQLPRQRLPAIGGEPVDPGPRHHPGLVPVGPHVQIPGV